MDPLELKWGIPFTILGIHGFNKEGWNKITKFPPYVRKKIKTLVEVPNSPK
jgi:hypothetical protein